jgi:predicted nucleic acid-binding protein
MNITIDASAIIAVITNEKSKSAIIKATENSTLVAPESIHWEIGDAFSAMFKRGLIQPEQAIAAVKSYTTIPIRFVTVELELALELSYELNIYAYDAYLLQCAIQHKTPLLTLDGSLAKLAVKKGIRLVEVK